MTNVKQYFRSHLKANLRLIIYIFAAVLVVSFLFGIENQPTSRYDFELQKTFDDYKCTLNIPVTILAILTYVIPVMEFSFFKKRVNLDCAYALPISRRAMGMVHYVTGLITLFGAFSASYLVNLLLLISRGKGWFDFSVLPEHFLLCLLVGFAVYSVFVFVFNEANTKGDGIWFILLYTFVWVLVLSALGEVFDSMLIYEANKFPWGSLYDLTNSYKYIVEMDNPDNATFWQSPDRIAWFAFWVALGISSFVGFFLTFGKRRMEKTEEISDSYFGFRTLIPIFAVSGMIFFGEVIVFWVIIELLAILGYTIYRRGFHYKKSDIAILLALFILLFI